MSAQRSQDLLAVHKFILARCFHLVKEIFKNQRLHYDLARGSYTPSSGAFSGNNPGIQREARAAGKARRRGARELSDTKTSLFRRADTTRRAWRSPVPATVPASPRGSSPR